MTPRQSLERALRTPAVQLAVGTDRASAVLLPVVERPDGPRLVMVKKAAELRKHAGQLGFPGGGIESGETPEQAALREAWEEVGLSPDAVEILGALDDDRTYVTSYHIRPLLGWIAQPPHTWRMDPGEVQAVVELPLAEVMRIRPASWMETLIGTVPFLAPRYVFADGTVVWGASARILERFIARVRPHWTDAGLT